MKRFIFTMIIFCSSFSFAQNVDDFEKFQLKALKDLDAIGTYVWQIENIEEIDSLYSDSISVEIFDTLMMKELENNSINVISFREAGVLPGGPCFDTVIKFDRDSTSSTIAYSIIARFVQDVSMTRNPKILHYAASTWSENIVGITNEENLYQELKSKIKVLVSKFANDFKKIN